MAARRKGLVQGPPLEEAFPRPLCGCGKNSATHSVHLAVRRLTLDRESGVRSEPYWTAAWKGAPHTSIETLVCDDCLGSRINVAIAVDATMVQAKKGPPP